MNLKRNAIEVDVPRRLLGTLGPNANATSIPGAETYDATSQWGDQRQSAALAKRGVSDFGHPLGPEALRRRETHELPLTPGYSNRIFRSDYTYGEGIELKKCDSEVGVQAAGGAKPMFLGRFQPYGLYVPEGYSKAAGAPLLLDGHSLGVNHNEYAAVGTNSSHSSATIGAV